MWRLCPLAGVFLPFQSHSRFTPTVSDWLCGKGLAVQVFIQTRVTGGRGGAVLAIPPGQWCRGTALDNLDMCPPADGRGAVP